MTTFFCFSDESGDYYYKPTDVQLKNHPFYIRSNIIIRSDEWLKLSSKFKDLKKSYGLPLNKEVKFANLWEVMKWEKRGVNLPEQILFLRNHTYVELVEFIGKSISLLSELEFREVFISYTLNKLKNKFETDKLLKFHLQELMQRLQMGCRGSDLGIVFFDSLSDTKRGMFSNIYHELYQNGDIVQYDNIKDCLNFENSHQSVGVQLADFISGTFSSIVRSKTSGRITETGSVFLKDVFPLLRFNPKDRDVMGYGLREIPSDDRVRGEFKKLILSSIVGF